MKDKGVRFLLVCFGTFFGTWLYSQAPSADFSLVDPICIDEPVSLQDNSDNTTVYNWDFCAEDFVDTPSISLVSNLLLTDLPAGIELIEEGGSWYGFVTSRSNNSIIRLEFGDSPNNTPTETDLGSFGGILLAPDEISMIKEGDIWYALITSDGSPYNLIRLEFEDGIESVPEATNLGNFSSLNRPRGISIQNDGGTVVVLISNFNNNNVTLLDFGSTISSQLADIIVHNTSAILGGSNVIDMSVIDYNGIWYGFAVSLGNNTLHRLEFGSNLLNSSPTVTNFSLSGSIGPSMVDVVEEGDSTYFFIGKGADLNTTLYAIEDLAGTFTPGEIGIPGSQILSGVDLVSYEGGKIFMGVSTSDELYAYHFNSACSANIYESTEQTPIGVRYATNGSYTITLKARNEDGVDFHSEIQTVTSTVAPDITFTIDDSRCTENENTFTSTNGSGDITSYQWIFGDD
ncbi:MAG: PKD domain-containing protein, partial [bacterium]|nr:PKD domain-containing protein [bacterium]